MDRVLDLEREADMLENSAAEKRRRAEQLKTDLEEKGKQAASE